MNEGYLKGEKCNRNGCEGIIAEHYTDTCCSCHNNPPCSHCTTSREYCPVCDWSGRDEQIETESKITESYGYAGMPGLSYYNSEGANTYRSRVLKMMSGQMARPNTLMYVNEGHTHFSMIKKGIFPEGMKREDLLKEINGTFGGRFQYYNADTGVFNFIAYTD